VTSRAYGGALERRHRADELSGGFAARFSHPPAAQRPGRVAGRRLAKEISGACPAAASVTEIGPQSSPAGHAPKNSWLYSAAVTGELKKLELVLQNLKINLKDGNENEKNIGGVFRGVVLFGGSVGF
ncbi:MAG TPA: hypothetical protein VIM00_10065, partial [Candidatus Acidoferrum sp.]